MFRRFTISVVIYCSISLVHGSTFNQTCWRSWDHSCIDGKNYTTGDFNVTIANLCNVEPKEENLNFVDSMWTWYDCIVRATLGGEPLTWRSYVEMMSRNLNESDRARILSQIEDSVEGKYETPVEGDTRSSITALKSYWKGYFKFEDLASGNAIVENNLTSWMRLFHTASCKDGDIPYFLPTILDLTDHSKIRDCVKQLRQLYGNKTVHRTYGHAWTLCSYITTKSYHLNEIVGKRINPEKLIDDMQTNCWSKSVKQHAKKLVVKILSKSFAPKGSKRVYPLDDLVEKIEKQFDARFRAVPSASNSSMNNGINGTDFLKKTHVVATIIEASNAVQVIKLCADDGIDF